MYYFCVVLCYIPHGSALKSSLSQNCAKLCAEQRGISNLRNIIYFLMKSFIFKPNWKSMFVGFVRLERGAFVISN